MTLVPNGFGNFIFGLSPFGIQSDFDSTDTLLSQYANSPVILALIESFDDAEDQTENFQNFFDFIWNITTARGYGLDMWGRIVGVSRTLQVATGVNFGFEGTDQVGFGQAAFYSGGGVTENYDLSDTEYRNLILAKAFVNIIDGSMNMINAFLQSLFPDQGQAYLTNGRDMTMVYNFSWHLTPVQQAIVEQADILPTPSGVAFTIVFP